MTLSLPQFLDHFRPEISASGAHGGLVAGERNWILARIVKKPDLTLSEIVTGLQAVRGIRVARETVWRMLRRENLTFKKNADRDGALAARREAAQRALDQTLSAYSA